MISDKHEIYQLRYNYFNTNEEWGSQVAHVGINGVTEIHEYPPHNGMELHCFDIHKEDGSVTRVFNPNVVEYKLKENG